MWTCRRCFCAAWECETTRTVYWNPEGDLFTKARNSTRPGLSSSSCKGTEHYFCHNFSCAKVLLSQSWTGVDLVLVFFFPIVVKFTESGKNVREDWLKGRTWGLQIL